VPKSAAEAEKLFYSLHCESKTWTEIKWNCD